MSNDTHAILSELLQSLVTFTEDVDNGLAGKKHKKIRKQVLKHVFKLETKIEDYQYNTDVGGD